MLRKPLTLPGWLALLALGATHAQAAMSSSAMLPQRALSMVMLSDQPVLTANCTSGLRAIGTSLQLAQHVRRSLRPSPARKPQAPPPPPPPPVDPDDTPCVGGEPVQQVDPSLPTRDQLEKKRKNYATTVGYAVVGAAICTAVVAVIRSGAKHDGDRPSIGVFTLGCGVLGGAIGELVRQLDIRQMQQIISNVDLIGKARARNCQLLSIQSSMNELIASETQRVTALQARIASGEIQKKDAKSELQDIDKSIETLRKTRDSLLKDQANYEKTVATMNGGNTQDINRLNKLLARSRQQIAVLQQKVTTLEDIRKTAAI